MESDRGGKVGTQSQRLHWVVFSWGRGDLRRRTGQDQRHNEDSKEDIREGERQKRAREKQEGEEEEDEGAARERTGPPSRQGTYRLTVRPSGRSRRAADRERETR